MPAPSQASNRPILVKNVPASVSADILWRTQSDRGRLGLTVKAKIAEAFLPLPFIPTALAFPPPLLIKESLEIESSIALGGKHSRLKTLSADAVPDLLGIAVKHHCLMKELEVVASLIYEGFGEDHLVEGEPPAPEWMDSVDNLWAQALDICQQAAEIARPFAEAPESPLVRHVDVLPNIAPEQVEELEAEHEHLTPDRLTVPLMSASFAVDADLSRIQLLTSWPTKALITDGGDAGAAFTERYIEEVGLWSNGRLAEAVNPSGTTSAISSNPASLQPLLDAVLSACQRGAVIHGIASAWCAGSRLPLKECESALANPARVEWTPMLIDVTERLDEPSKSMILEVAGKAAPSPQKRKPSKGPSP